MKVLMLAMMMVSGFALAQSEGTFTQADLDKVSAEMERSLEGKPKKERKFLKKLSKMIKKVGSSKVVKKTGRGLGKATTFIAVETARPFVSAASFFKGTFQKLDSNDAKVKSEVFSFYLDNEKDLNELYKNPEIYSKLVEKGDSESIGADYKLLIETMMKDKALNSIKGMLRDIKFNPSAANGDDEIKYLLDASSLEELAEMLENLDLQNPMIYADLEMDKVNNETLHKNMRCNKLGALTKYVDIAPLEGIVIRSILTGDNVNPDDLMSMIDLSFIDDIKEFINSFIDSDDGKVWKNKKIISEVAENVVALTAQFAVPAMALGAISSGLAGPYVAVTAVSVAGAAISTAVCTSKKNKSKIQEDAEFRNFCSYIIFRSSQKLIKSKAKGYLSGQKFRTNVLGHKANLKHRRNEMKVCVDGVGRRYRRLCRLQYKLEKTEEIKECTDSGKSKRECKKIRRERLRADEELM
jgi:hypothetical protein